MAKQFYSVEEAQNKLGLTEEELKQLIRDGQLREFRDGGKVLYKTEEVDSLANNLATLSGSLSGTSGELVLEPTDETSMGLTGSDMLELDEAERTDDNVAVVDDPKEDTVITSVGISVFDDEDMAEADPAAKTVPSTLEPAGGSGGTGVLTGSGSGGSGGSGGTGSGLLDLTREADDTSLGAELLDEIYSEDQEAGLPEIGEATRAGLDAAIPEEREQEEIFEPVAPAAAEAAASVPTIVEGGAGPVEAGLSGAMLGAILVLAVAGVAVSANLQGVAASMLEPLVKNLLIAGGVFVGVTLICFVVGFLLGRRAAR